MKNHGLNLADLDRYLRAEVEGFTGLTSVTKFPNGQSNPTFLLRAESANYVLRMQPLGELLKSAHAVDREYRVIKALEQTDVPVPKAIHLCHDRDVIGSMFFLMSFQQGRIFWNPSIPELDNSQRLAIYREMNRTLAALHSVNIDEVGLEDYGRPGNYFARQVDRWTRQYRASEIDPIAGMDQLIEWLPDHIPLDDGKVSLIHGDYRIDNIVFSDQGTEVVAILDWELSTLGHPYADLAYQCMQWRIDQAAVIGGLGGIDRQALGIPLEQDYVSEYCQRRDLTGISNWNFYLVFSFFRLAAILQGVLKRAVDGNASSKKAFDYGAMAPMLATMATALID